MATVPAARCLLLRSLSGCCTARTSSTSRGAIRGAISNRPCPRSGSGPAPGSTPRKNICIALTRKGGGGLTVVAVPVVVQESLHFKDSHSVLGPQLSRLLKNNVDSEPSLLSLRLADGQGQISTAVDSSNPSGTSRPQRLRQTTTGNSPVGLPRWLPDLTQRASAKPEAVQPCFPHWRQVQRTRGLMAIEKREADRRVDRSDRRCSCLFAKCRSQEW